MKWNDNPLQVNKGFVPFHTKRTFELEWTKLDEQNQGTVSVLKVNGTAEHKVSKKLAITKLKDLKKYSTESSRFQNRLQTKLFEFNHIMNKNIQGKHCFW